MSRDEVLAAIPHREPFLMIDEVVEQSESRIVCKRRFRPDEWFYQGHYPKFPITPGVLLCECCLQAGAILLSKHSVGDGIPVATRMGDVKFKRMVRPGDEVFIEVVLNERLADAFYLTGKATCDGKLAARLDFAVAVAKPEQA